MKHTSKNTTKYKKPVCNKSNPYMTLSAKLYNDDRLSSTHKGVMVDLLKNAEPYVIYKKNILDKSGMGRKMFDRVWSTLVEYGYIKVKRTDKGGTIYHYTINGISPTRQKEEPVQESSDGDSRKEKPRQSHASKVAARLIKEHKEHEAQAKKVELEAIAPPQGQPIVKNDIQEVDVVEVKEQDETKPQETQEVQEIDEPVQVDEPQEISKTQEVDDNDIESEEAKQIELDRSSGIGEARVRIRANVRKREAASQKAYEYRQLLISKGIEPYKIDDDTVERARVLTEGG